MLRRALALVVVSCAALPQAAVAAHLCELQGAVTSHACCCTKTRAPAAAGDTVQRPAADCCSVSLPDASPAPVAVTSEASPLPRLALAALLTNDGGAQAAPGAAVHAGRPRGPPQLAARRLHLQHCVQLI